MTDTSTPSCPVVHGQRFDPGQQVADPFPWLRAARHEQPVFFIPETGEWCVTRYEDVLSVLHDPITFSSRYVVNPRPVPGTEQLEDGHPVTSSLVNTDPPEHTRLRKVSQKGFARARIASHEGLTRDLADGLVDELERREQFDAMAGFAEPFVAAGVCAFVGLPASEAPRMLRWQEGVVRSMETAPPLSPEMAVEVGRRIVDFDGLLRELIAARREEPRDDLTSLLIAAEVPTGDPQLSTGDVLRLVSNVLAASTANTSNLICFLLQRLLEDRSRWERIIDDRSLLARAIDETMREAGPVRAVRRDVVDDTTIGGVPIPAGARIYLSYASAQHDESVFEDPEVWDLDRPGLSRQIGLGKGAHFCLGGPLARMEVTTALNCLMDRLPEMRLAHPENVEVVPHHRMHHLLQHLQIVPR